jgi:hypothetical protein
LGLHHVYVRRTDSWFRDWPNTEVPPFGAGVYTIWDDTGTLVYVGMSGRTISVDTQPRTKPYGLYTRLASHAAGRRSGNQFCVYVADRLVLPSLTPERIRLIGAGALEFDELVRSFIHEHLGYRLIIVASGVQARRLEDRIKRGVLSAGAPLLNPPTPRVRGITSSGVE